MNVPSKSLASSYAGVERKPSELLKLFMNNNFSAEGYMKPLQVVDQNPLTFRPVIDCINVNLQLIWQIFQTNVLVDFDFLVNEDKVS